MPLVRINNAPGFHVKKGAKLIDILNKNGISVYASCGGRGFCGSCRVKMAGEVRQPGIRDKDLISPKMLKQGYRLACQYKIDKSISVALPEAVKEQAPSTRRNTGLALDIGTTVIKGALVDLRTREVLKTAKIYNPQNEFGGDVMTRIGITLLGQYRVLRKYLTNGINKLKSTLGANSPVFTAVAGNPVMASFFLGRSVSDLSHYPYKSKISKGILLVKPMRYIFGTIGGFVGGDTIAGIMASGLRERKGTSLYIDLGTNGEIALISERRIYAVSTAAGPAFEGAGLKCGSLAIPGAIDSIDYRGGFTIHTIAERKQTGICASGLIDLLAVLLRIGWLAENGQLQRKVELNGIKVYQEDIRKLQLAIGAIHAGISFLLDKTRIHAREIKQAVITGEFGSKLNLASLRRIGIIPGTLAEVRFEKDLPLKGAIMVLTDWDMIRSAEKIRMISRHLELAMQPNFQDKFLSALRLKPWN